MTSTTHTEIYRRMRGELRSRAVRWWPLFIADIRAAQRKKLPLLLLFSLPTIAGVVFSFVVYAKYTLESGNVPGVGEPAARGVAMAVGSMLEVRTQIAQFNIQCAIFALLVIAWFGAGMIAEDKRAGAHLLYFSRPLTRLDYFVGHFLSVCTMGLCAVLAPGLMICIVATFTSPDFAFLKDDWELVLATIGYSLLFVSTLSALVLAVSSLASRKAFALVATFALLLGSTAVGGALRGMKQDEDYFMASLNFNFQRIGDWMFDKESVFDWDPAYSLWIVCGVMLASLLVCALRLRRLEVVA